MFSLLRRLLDHWRWRGVSGPRPSEETKRHAAEMALRVRARRGTVPYGALSEVAREVGCSVPWVHRIAREIDIVVARSL